MKTNKLYINITNHCNAYCPFCCMYSGDHKKTFMSFDTFYKIVTKASDFTDDTDFIVQLEGGEPTMHPELYLFLEFLCHKPKVKQIVIDTNALNLDKHIDKITEIATRNKKHILIKPSFNSYIALQYIKKYAPLQTEEWQHEHALNCFMIYLRNIISGCEFLEYIDFELNVRGYTKDDCDKLVAVIPEELQNSYNVHKFNSYGRAKNAMILDDLTITPTYDNWSCYASDGKNWGTDLIGRSEYEKTLK